MSVEITDSNFDETVIKSDVPVVVDFWAEWCKPCLQIAPSLEELAKEYKGNIKIVKLNIDKNPEIPTQLGVRSIPALFLYNRGKIISTKTGSYPKNILDVWIRGSLVMEEENE